MITKLQFEIYKRQETLGKIYRKRSTRDGSIPPTILEGIHNKPTQMVSTKTFNPKM